MPRHWTDAELDSMRAKGDPHADLVARAVYEKGQVDEVNRLLKVLVSNDQPPPRELPTSVRDYFGVPLRLPDWADRRRILEAQRLFARYAPLVTVILNCCSLPGSYLAKKGAVVIHQTGRLSGDPRRRIVETAQLVFDVMRPGGLAATGEGMRTTQKVRLMHGAIRHLLLLDPQQPWDRLNLGMPINQEDMAGVMITFSVAVTESLTRLGVSLEDRERESYLHAWKVVAHLLGLQPEMMPDDYAAALELGREIERRHFGDSPEGKELTEVLRKMLEEAIPGDLLDGVPVAMMRFLLDDRRADLLGLPQANALEKLIECATRLIGAIDAKMDDSPHLQAVTERFGTELLRMLLRSEAGHRRVPFRLPEALRESLEPAAASAAPSFFARFFRFVGNLPFPLFVSRRFAFRAPYAWLRFATRFKDDDGVIGAEFFKEFAARVDARVRGRGTPAGLMDDFDELRSDDFEPYAVADVIRRFYEHTTDFDLALEVDWSWYFKPIGLLYRELVARRIRTFDFPIGVVKDLENWIELIDLDHDDDPDLRAWIRVHGNQRHPMWVGAYKVYRSTIEGTQKSFISVAFPTPGGNLTTVLAPHNFRDDGLRLTSRDGRTSEAGIYQIIPRERWFAMFPAYGLHEVFELLPAHDRQGVKVSHVSRWLGLKMFEMRYDIRPKRRRDPKRVREFCDRVGRSAGRA